METSELTETTPSEATAEAPVESTADSAGASATAASVSDVTPASDEAAPLEIKISVDPGDVDEDQFVSVWNVAAATMDKDPAQTRMLASKFLGFLCKHRCGFVVATPTDAKYLDEWYERDNKLLHDWKPESDKVDVVTQHIQVPFETFVHFLDDNKFSAEKNYSPRRADRLSWFTEDWNVG